MTRAPVSDREAGAGSGDNDEEEDQLRPRVEHAPTIRRPPGAPLESKLRDACGGRQVYGASAARMMRVVSFACHSDCAKASSIFSSGYVCETKRSNGQRVRFRTRKSRARGITHGSYMMTPTMRLAPHTSDAGSNSILAPRLIVPISR